jgi:2-hydroxy-3-oxopropionate reductase
MADASRPAIAFLGIGLMGEPMARRLLAAGFALTVWSRSPAKAESLAGDGAKIAASPADAARGAEIAITMLANGPAVSEVLFEGGIADTLGPGALFIDMSSIPPAMARGHAERLAGNEIACLDAPVSGGVRGATDGTLAIMAGGGDADFERARPVLEVLGRPTLIGPAGSGQLAKLANQAIVGITIEAVAEALLLASAGGADPARVREALMGGFADSTILRQHGERMIEREWIPGGRMSMHLKDMRTILDEMGNLGLDLPVVRCVAGMFESGNEAGFADYDHSGLLLELERRNPGARVGTKPDHAPGDA